MMLHDRDDKYEGSEETEYHFSEEEGGDYLDTELPKEAAPAASEPKVEASGVASLAPSKRMLISLVVFLVLVYVVYKMVAPTSSVPSTDITTPVASQATTTSPKTAPVSTMKQAAPQQAATTANANVPNAAPVATQPAPPASMAQQQPIVAAPPTVQQPTMNQPAPAVSPSAGTPPPVAATSQPVAQNLPQQPMTQQVAPPQAMPQPTAANGQQQIAATQPQAPSVVIGLPTVIPVQSPAPIIQNPVSGDARVLAVEAESAKLMNQLQSDYLQKLNDFSMQNKALQEQIQTLNSRMSTMETQITQLVQTLIRQSQGGGVGTDTMAPTPAEQQSIEQKISYNVQAIIPGRAWLRSDNGETLTVAEGDVIKNLGRVTKIDPYDGIVEINAGNKVISLSYGMGSQ